MTFKPGDQVRIIATEDQLKGIGLAHRAKEVMGKQGTITDPTPAGVGKYYVEIPGVIPGNGRIDEWKAWKAYWYKAEHLEFIPPLPGEEGEI